MRNLLTCLAICLAFTISAQRTPQQLGMMPTDLPAGLEVGAMAPAFEGVTDDGETVSLSAMLENGAVALIFYRGFWCGKCSRYLSVYQDSLQYLKDMGFQLVAVTPENTDGVIKTRDKNNLNFTILSDKGGEIMRAYDVDFKVTDDYVKKIHGYYQVDIADNNDADVAELPVPATYLIVPDGNDGGGKIIWRHFDLDYGKRASVKAMVDAVKSFQ
ncbi:MAG: peroxiredoxin-like family protein [Saprospiraceae bacterium]|nr:peroxiredoxin-like family protein [Saprospiraceae bacterium]